MRSRATSRATVSSCRRFAAGRRGRSASRSETSPGSSSERTMGVESRPPKRVTVVVADDHPLYRDGVVRALSASGQVEIVAEAADGRAALAQIQEHRPDVALLDYKLPELDGVSVTNAVVRDQLP